MQIALFLTVLGPAVVAAGLLALSWALGRGEGTRKIAAGATAFVAPAGALAACVPVRGFPELPPTDASLWPIWVGFVVAISAAIEGLRSPPSAVQWASRAGFSLVVAVLVSEPLMRHSWTATTSILVTVGTAAVATAAWAALARRAARAPGPALPFALAALTAGTAAVLGASGTALLAQCTGGVAVAWGVLMLASTRGPGVGAGATVGPTVAILAGFLLGGAIYAEVSFASIAFVALAALGVGLIPLRAPLDSGWRATTALGLVVVIGCGAAMAAALWPTLGADPGSSEPSSDEDEYDGYGY